MSSHFGPGLKVIDDGWSELKTSLDSRSGETLKEPSDGVLPESAGIVTQVAKPNSLPSASPKQADQPHLHGDIISAVNKAKEMVMEGVMMYPGYAPLSQAPKEKAEDIVDTSKRDDLVMNTEPRASDIGPEQAAKILDLVDAVERLRPVGGVTGLPPAPTEPAMMALSDKVANIFDKKPLPDEEVTRPTIEKISDTENPAIGKRERRKKTKLVNRPSAVPSENPDHIKRYEVQSKKFLSDDTIALLNRPVAISGGMIQPRHEECTSIGCDMDKTELAAFLITLFILVAVVMILLVTIPIKYGPRIWAFTKSKIGGGRRNSVEDRDRAITDIESQALGSTSTFVERPKSVRFIQL